MFNNCKSLISFRKLSNDDEENLRITENVVNTENNEQIKENKLFPNSTSHDNTSDFYNTNKNSFSVIDKFSIIDEKNFKLKALNHNYILLNGIFSNCESLESLPDIDKWEINLVSDMSYMFYNCKSLLSLPDISN